ncbi:MAG: TonB-dependent receptor plug domain-containing protein, partial [Paludibacteraceae bacterium]|nr:TonB-dependent receptor plug domain-containing protein [Paludibacteraceae bacterium]
MKKILLLVLMFCSLNLLAQDEKNIDLTEVEVLGEKYELESNATRIIMVMDSSRLANLSVSSIGEALNYAPGVDIRQRGANGVQSDISMRGG